MADSTRFFVVHIRKAAGTSLRNRFVHAFGTDGVYPNRSDGKSLASLISLPVLAERWPVRRDEVRVITGHFPLCAVDMLDEAFTTLTVLRHPVDRTLSFLRFQKRIIPDDASRSLEEIYDIRPRFDTHIRNHMTRMYGMTLTEALEGDGGLTIVPQTPDLLDRAKRGLDRIDEVGLHEDFGTFCDRLVQRHGLDLGGDVVTNTSPGPDAPASLVRRIIDDHALDLELYDYARELTAARA